MSESDEGVVTQGELVYVGFKVPSCICQCCSILWINVFIPALFSYVGYFLTDRTLTFTGSILFVWFFCLFFFFFQLSQLFICCDNEKRKKLPVSKRFWLLRLVASLFCPTDTNPGGSRCCPWPRFCLHIWIWRSKRHCRVSLSLSALLFLSLRHVHGLCWFTTIIYEVISHKCIPENDNETLNVEKEIAQSEKYLEPYRRKINNQRHRFRKKRQLVCLSQSRRVYRSNQVKSIPKNYNKSAWMKKKRRVWPDAQTNTRRFFNEWFLYLHFAVGRKQPDIN